MLLNIPRLGMRPAVAVMQGLGFDRDSQLPFAVFDAAALSEEEADFTQTDTNIKRLIAEAIAEAKRRL